MISSVEINKKHQITGKAYSLRACYSEYQPPSLAFVRDPKTNIGVRKLSAEKRERLRYILIGNYWHGLAGGRLTRNGASYVIVREAYLASSS